MIKRGNVYKVWIVVEEYNVETGERHDIDVSTLPPSATFRRLNQAIDVAHRIGAIAAESGGQVEHV